MPPGRREAQCLLKVRVVPRLKRRSRGSPSREQKEQRPQAGMVCPWKVRGVRGLCWGEKVEVSLRPHKADSIRNTTGPPGSGEKLLQSEEGLEGEHGASGMKRLCLRGLWPV